MLPKPPLEGIILKFPLLDHFNCHLNIPKPVDLIQSHTPHYTVFLKMYPTLGEYSNSWNQNYNWLKWCFQPWLHISIPSAPPKPINSGSLGVDLAISIPILMCGQGWEPLHYRGHLLLSQEKEGACLGQAEGLHNPSKHRSSWEGWQELWRTWVPSKGWGRDTPKRRTSVPRRRRAPQPHTLPSWETNHVSPVS